MNQLLDGWVYLKSVEQGAIQMSVVGKNAEWTSSCQGYFALFLPISHQLKLLQRS